MARIAERIWVGCRLSRKIFAWPVTANKVTMSDKARRVLKVPAGANVVVSLVFSAYHKRIDRAVKDIVMAAELCGVKRSGPVVMPTRKKSWTILRSPFVNKKSQETLALHTHRRLLQVEGEKDTVQRFVNFVVDVMEPLLTVKVYESTLHDLTKFWTFGGSIAKARQNVKPATK